MAWSLFSKDTSDTANLSGIDQIYRSWKENGASKVYFHTQKDIPQDETTLKELSIEGILQYVVEEWKEPKGSTNSFQVFFFQFLSHASEYIQNFSHEEVEDILAVVEKLGVISMLDYCFHNANITPKFFLKSLLVAHEGNTISHASKAILKQWKNSLDSRSLPCWVDIPRLLNRIIPGESVFTEKDGFGRQANNLLSLLSLIEQQNWSQFIWYARQNKLSGTSAKNQKDIRSLITTLGEDRFFKMIAVWVDHIEKMKISEIFSEHYTTYEFIVPDNREVLKGLCIGLGILQTQESLALLSRLALVFYKKIPNKWPASIELGNICVVIMADQFGLQSISPLFQIRHKTRHPSTQKYIDKQILGISKKIGYSPEQLEDMSIPEYEISERNIVCPLPDGASGVLEIGTYFSVSLTWKDTNGKIYKSPTTQMSEHSEIIRDIKLEKKELQLTLSYLKSKFENILLTGRTIEWSHFEKYFLTHPVVSLYVRWLIWNVHNLQGEIVDIVSFWGISPKNISWQSVMIENGMSVQLFHPCEIDPATSLSWQMKITQAPANPPFKQADRECYESWDRRSKVTWIILAQHQSVALAKERGWIAQLVGDFDSGFDGFSKTIPSANITVLLESDGIGFTDLSTSGIYPEIVLKDIVWSQIDTRALLSEESIPRRIYSEILRDIDLFLSVTVKK